MENKCVICKAKIKTMAFRGTGVCCENHRKLRDGENPDQPQESRLPG